MAEDLGKELGWDDQIENEGQEFELLPEGTYDYTVENMARGRFADGCLQLCEPDLTDPQPGDRKGLPGV